MAAFLDHQKTIQHSRLGKHVTTSWYLGSVDHSHRRFPKARFLLIMRMNYGWTSKNDSPRATTFGCPIYSKTCIPWSKETAPSPTISWIWRLFGMSWNTYVPHPPAPAKPHALIVLARLWKCLRMWNTWFASWRASMTITVMSRLKFCSWTRSLPLIESLLLQTSRTHHHTLLWLKPLHLLLLQLWPPKIGLNQIKARDTVNQGLPCSVPTARKPTTPLRIVTSSMDFPRVTEQNLRPLLSKPLLMLQSPFPPMPPTTRSPPYPSPKRIIITFSSCCSNPSNKKVRVPWFL